MSGLERQLSEYSAREAEVERIAKDSKEKIEEALVMRDQVRYKYRSVLDETTPPSVSVSNGIMGRLSPERNSCAVKSRDCTPTARSMPCRNRSYRRNHWAN